MKTNKLAACAFVLFVLSHLCTSGRAAEKVPSSHDWIERPWEIRYVLLVDTDRSMKYRVQAARKVNVKRTSPRNESIYFEAEEMYEPTAAFSVPGADSLVMVVLQFDRAGRVAGPNKRLNPFTAKRNVLDDIVLVRDATSTEKPYYVADWSQGVPGDVSFSPAVCDVTDTHRYEDGWDSEYSGEGNVGCREWTAALYGTDPYIDVTTYTKHGTFIGAFVGWSRFTDPPKPVIGRHGQTWLCLYDCPPGEKAGVIRDIKTWTTKHGFPMPERPPRQPLYPNRDYDFND